MDKEGLKNFLSKKVTKKDIHGALEYIFESSLFKKKIFLGIIIFFSIAHFVVRNYEHFSFWDIDAPSFYTAAEGVLRDINIYDHNAFQDLANELFGRSQTVYPYLYWPVLAQFFTPFTLLDYKSYFDVLLVINFLLSFCCFFLIYKLLELQKNQNNITLMFLFIAFSWNRPLIDTFQLGQINILVLTLILLALWLLKKDKEFLSSFFLCLAVYFKIYPVLFLFLFMLQKRYRYVIYTAVNGVLVFLLSVSIFSFKPWESFIRMGLNNFLFGKKSEFFFDFNAQWGNVSVNGFLSQLFIQLGLPRSLVMPVFLILIGLTILIFRKKIVQIIRCRDINFGASVVIILSLVLSTISWSHHYVIMIYPLAFFLNRISTEKRYAYLPLFILLALPILKHPWAGGFPFFQIIMLSAVLILFLMIKFQLGSKENKHLSSA
ncbi:MAG: DUF2029 domain-containing protein [Candidatus Aminicenantes bacterium]|nr:DUF2029 domain-containing protein [Candidatus Aminicenantes bacterium]